MSRLREGIRQVGDAAVDGYAGDGPYAGDEPLLDSDGLSATRVVFAAALALAGSRSSARISVTWRLIGPAGRGGTRAPRRDPAGDDGFLCPGERFVGVLDGNQILRHVDSCERAWGGVPSSAFTFISTTNGRSGILQAGGKLPFRVRDCSHESTGRLLALAVLATPTAPPKARSRERSESRHFNRARADFPQE